MRIAGSGSLPGGDYNEDIAISGSGKITGNASCTGFSIAGSGKVQGDLVCRGKFAIAGSGKVEGNLTAETAAVSGSGAIGGASNVSGDFRVSGACRTGAVKCGKFIISGAVNTDGDVSAEEATIRGSIDCSGLINAEIVDAEISGDSFADSIGGGTITIRDRKGAQGFFSRLLSHRARNRFTVANNIEGDVITLENVTADTVIGRDVTIGPGCKVRHVVYTNHIEISAEADVELYEESSAC